MNERQLLFSILAHHLRDAIQPIVNKNPGGPTPELEGEINRSIAERLFTLLPPLPEDAKQELRRYIAEDVHTAVREIGKMKKP